MSKIVFDQTGQRYFETGVSDVVLYVWDSANNKYGKGVGWNGVSAISESPEGGEDNYVYADNIKYLNLKSVEEWNGSIQAYSSPKEFDACDGSITIADGISFGQQSRKTFAIAFMSRIGNDTEGDKLGKMLTIIYGCSAKPSSRDHNTVNDNPEAQELSWDLSSLPVNVGNGYNALSTIKVKSTECSAANWTTIINTLYGTDATEAVYTKTTDTSVDTSKTYYTRSGSEGSYTYTEVTSPSTSEIANYYELTTPATTDSEPTLMMPADFQALATA